MNTKQFLSDILDEFNKIDGSLTVEYQEKYLQVL